MLARTKFFSFLLVLHCPPSLLLPLEQQHVASATNNLAVLETNEVELTPNNSKVPEILQQIDVKDKENKVVSNISEVIINKESNNNIVTSKILPIAPEENASVSTTLKLLDGENILHVTEPAIAWRSDVPAKRKSKKQNTPKHSNINAINNNNENSAENNVSDDSNNNIRVEKKTENEEEKSIFVLLNSGNIDGLTVNTRNDNLQTNSDTIVNLNSNSDFLINLINATINNVLSNILPKNHTILNTKHIFLLLNSGSIKNIHISSPVLENIAKTMKERSRRHLNDIHTNNSTVESVHLKQPDNTTAANYNKTNDISVEDISSAEAQAFRSLIPDKIRKLQQATNAVSTTIEPNTTKDHNLVLKLSPESPPITIDLQNIPFNNILGGALNIIKRFKRNTNEEATTECKEIQIGKHTVKSCTQPKSKNNLKLKTTRKFLKDSISNVLNMFDTVEIECTLSVIAKLLSNQVIEQLTNISGDGIINKILRSLLEGNENSITLITKELLEAPIPVKLRLQLVHGNTKEVMEMISNAVDATLCSFT